MKLHLPLSVLRMLTVTAALIPAVTMAEITGLTEDTILTPTGSIMTTTSDSMGYTSADAADKKDLTITEATTTVYELGRDKSLSFDGLDVFSMKDNNAVTAESGLIRGNKNGLGTISMSNNNKVVLDNNDTVSTGSNMYGGVIRSYRVGVNINNNGSVDITNNNYTTTASSNSNTYGGAVYVTGENPFNMSNNGAVNISGNSLTSKATAHGGAVDIGQISGTEVMKWDANASITVSGNKAEGNQARGGALHAKSATTISNTTGTVSFSGNEAYSSASTAFGGAISLEGNGKVNFQNNSTVEFINNSAQGNAYTYNDPAAGGGAIHGINLTTFDFTGNKEVNFIGNVASNANGKAIGGAIYATSTGSIVNISGNDNVTFSGNGVEAAGAAYAFGGAIFSKGGVALHDNQSVVFEKNYEKGGDTYRLRSIYARDTSSSNPVNLALSAADGGTFTIKDSITVSGNLDLNEDYEGKSQNGTFIFSGKTTESDLNAIIAAHTAEGETARKATAEEITLSRTSDIAGSITLHNGTLSLQDDAILKATELIIKEGATLEGICTNEEIAMVFAMSAEDEAVLDSVASLDADLVLEDGAILNMVGGSIDLNGKALTMGSNVQVSYTGNAAEGEEVVLFRNVGSTDATEFELTLNGKTTTATLSDGNVVVEYTASVPEPTTATLSLLALAALAARRRRK